MVTACWCASSVMRAVVDLQREGCNAFCKEQPRAFWPKWSNRMNDCSPFPSMIVFSPPSSYPREIATTNSRDQPHQWWKCSWIDTRSLNTQPAAMWPVRCHSTAVSMLIAISCSPRPICTPGLVPQEQRLRLQQINDAKTSRISPVCCLTTG